MNSLPILTERRRAIDLMAFRYVNFEAMPEPLLDDLADAIHAETKAQIIGEMDAVTTRKSGQEGMP